MRSMNPMWWITFGFKLFTWFLLSADAMVTIELWMSYLNFSRTNTSQQFDPFLFKNYLFTVTLHVGNQARQIWNFSAKLDEHSNGGEMFLRFPEFLSSSQHNPLMYSTSYKNLHNSSVGLTIVVHDPRSKASLVPIARFHTVWSIHAPITVQAADAPLQQVAMVDTGAKFTVSLRWYCSNQFFGDRCDLPCNASTCGVGKSANDSPKIGNNLEHLSLTSIRIPPLGDADCPCATCLIVDVPEIHFLNRTMLKTYLDLFMLLRADLSDLLPGASSSQNLPVHINTWLQLKKVWQSDNKPVVAVCASASWNGQQLAPKLIRKSLVDLVTSGWIYTVLTQDSRLGKSPSFSSSNLVNEVDKFMDSYHQIASKCNALFSSQAVLLGGFWLALCMTVCMSCLIAYLLHEQKKSEDSTVHSVDESIYEKHTETKCLMNTV